MVKSGSIEIHIPVYKKLTTKFLVMALLICLAPLVFLYFYSTNTASNMLIESLSDSLKEKAFLVGADIDRYFDQRKHDVITLSHADVLETDNIDAINQYLTEVIVGTPYLDDIDVINIAGVIIASSGEQHERGVQVLDMHPSLKSIFGAVLTAKRGDIFVSDVMELDSGPGLAFLTPITDDTNTLVIKVLLVEINLDTVKKIVADFDDRVIGDKYVYLVDNSGRVIVSADPESDLLSPYPDLSNNPSLLDHFSLQGDVGSIIYVDAMGEEVMAGFADMSEFGVNKAMDWSIIAVAPITDITKPVVSFKKNLLFISVVVFGVVMLVMFLAGHSILKTIQKLVIGARKVGSGDINFRFDPIPTAEFDLLAKTINHTLDNLVSAQNVALRAQRMEAVGQLTGGVAHDFNNLLAIMIGNAQFLEDRVGEDAESKELIGEIRAAIDRGSSLTSRLLAFSRQSVLTSVTANLSDLVGSLHDMLQRTLGETLELKFIDTADLWPAVIDPHQFENALINLAINARDAMPKGGTLTIEIANVTLDETYAEQHEEVRPGDYTVIAVSDTGTGMSPETLENAFEPFFTTKEVGKGSGLGLSMVYGFIKQSEGHVTINSEIDHGTTVKLYLPRSQEGVAKKDAATTAMDIARGSERILVVEDDPSVRKIAVTILRDQGYEITEAGNGEEAIEHLKTGRAFDLLFTDVVLPGGMTGVEIAETAKRLQPNLKVLYTTGYTENAIIDHVQLDPAMTIVNKPFRRQELLEKLREMLDSEDECAPRDYRKYARA